jgi:carboxyl-terminal processing protease
VKRSIPVALAAALLLSTSAVPAATVKTPEPQTISQQQTEELYTSYGYLLSDFYKKVDPQTTLNGAHDGLIQYLKANKVVNPTLPALHATGDDDANRQALRREVDRAVTLYAKDLKTVENLSPSTQLTYAAIAGTLASVKDRYTTFLSPAEFAALNDGLDGTAFGGVGISYSVDQKTNALHVESVIIDGPSDKAGLQADDEITAVDGKTIASAIAGTLSEKDEQKRLPLQQTIVTKLLRGEPGSKVTLTIDRAGKQLDPVQITRAEIKPPSVTAKLLPNGIGYVDLAVFGQNTGHELDAALKRLDSEGAKAYVLDLRRNGGGYLNAAVDVSSKFIASGPIVSVQSRAGTDTEYDAENDAIAPRPLAVLVDQYTASASEITAGAIQDSGVGTIIGVKTFGKGVVQSIWSLRDGSAIKITTARYLTPKGRDINHLGIAPQIESAIPKTLTGRWFGDPKTDPQLMSALTFLDGRLAQLSPTTAAVAPPTPTSAPQN